MAEAPINCRICGLRQTSRPAVTWCQNCSEGLCGSCQEHHSLSKSSENHNTITIAEYQELPRDVLQITDICPEHDNKYVMFCQNHLQPCCGTCRLQNHKVCKDIAKLEDVVQNYKSSVTLQELESSMKVSIENLTKVKADREKNLKTIETDCKNALDKIAIIRHNISKHLDDLQDNIRTELKTKREKIRNDIVDVLSFLDKENDIINDNLKTFMNVRNNATDLQAFLYSVKMERQMHAVENRILELMKDQSCSESKIKIKIEPFLKRFLDQLKRFGTVEVNTTPSTVVLRGKKETEAQMSLFTRQLEDIKLIEDKHINYFSTDCRSCCILTDGRMAFVDYHSNAILILNSNGKKEVNIFTPACPIDVTQVNDTTLALSSHGYNCGIHLINFNSRQITKSLRTGRMIAGITTRDDDHLIYFEYGVGLRMIRISDGTKTDIVRGIHLEKDTHVTSFGDSVMFTNTKTNRVSCYDIKGTHKWSFKDDRALRDPGGLSTDRDGNIYIAGRESENLVIISADGQKHRQFRCGPPDIYSLDYDKINDILLIVGKRGTPTVFKQN